MQPAPVTFRTGIIVEGGHLKQPWAVPAEALVNKDGATFICMSTCDRSLAACLGLPLSQRTPWKGNGFLDYLMGLRNGKVHAIMKQLVLAADPNGDGEVRRRKDLADELPGTIDITVEASEHYEMHSMRVMTCVNAQAKLHVEFTPRNMMWLVGAVHFGPPPTKRARRANGASVGELVPSVREVKNSDGSVTMITRYTDENGTNRTKSKRIPAMANFELMAQCTAEVAHELQSFHDAHHNVQGGEGNAGKAV